MGQTQTNNTALAYAIQESRGVLGGSPTWKSLEPNGEIEIGAQITTVARNPISKNRQRRKGTVTDLDSTFGYEADTTIDVLVDFLEAYFFSTAVNADLTFRGADVSSGYTIPAATASQAARLQFTSGGPISLVYAAGYANEVNNGLKPLSADTATSGTSIAVAGTTAETAPANAEVSIAGIRCEAGDLAVSISSGVATLTSNNNSVTNDVDFTTLGLTVGQRIHVGGMTAANRFGSTAAGDGTRSYGSGRIRTIAATTMTLDKLDATLVASDGTDDGTAGTIVPVDLLFGRFVRNVSTTSSEYLTRWIQFEAEWLNLYETDPPTPVAEPNGYEYALDNLADEMSWEMPLTNKSTITFGFVGTDAEAPVDGASRKTNADSPIEPLFTGAFNTSSDFLRLRVADTDDDGLTSDFKDVTATFRNNVTPEKVLGFLGARYMNLGNFEVDIEATALFTSPDVIARIRANTTVTMDWTLLNDDGAVAVDIPSMTIGDGARELPVNESIRVALACEAFQDSFFGTSASASLFPIYPAS
jgi:hypothetical protein